MMWAWTSSITGGSGRRRLHKAPATTMSLMSSLLSYLIFQRQLRPVVTFDQEEEILMNLDQEEEEGDGGEWFRIFFFFF